MARKRFFYLYISDTKIDMLLPQVPNTVKKKVSAEFGFDIKVLVGTIKTERVTLDTKIDRLVAVEEDIVTTKNIGTISEPQSWIAGEALAKTALLSENLGVVFFVIEEPGIIIAMGGSSRHLISKIESKEIESGFSFAPRLLDAFERIVIRNPEFLVNPRWHSELEGEGSKWMRIVGDASRQLRGTEQYVSFLAKRLLQGDYCGKKVILATPLYVSLAD